MRLAHKDYTYLCTDCAEKIGGRWPKGHVATIHVGICDSCGEPKALAHHDDWDWPDQKSYPGRD